MLDSDAALQLCIETLLLKNANRNHVEDDSAECSEKQSHDTLLARVLEIIPLLKSTNDLVTSLSGILYKVKNKPTKKLQRQKAKLLLKKINIPYCNYVKVYIRSRQGQKKNQKTSAQFFLFITMFGLPV